MILCHNKVILLLWYPKFQNAVDRLLAGVGNAM